MIGEIKSLLVEIIDKINELDDAIGIEYQRQNDYEYDQVLIAIQDSASVAEEEISNAYDIMESYAEGEY